jgi:hypothetical protein
MKKTKPILLILPIVGSSFASLLLLAANRKHQHADPVTVMGTVLDPAAMTPMPGVEVSWSSRRVTTNPAGQYEIELPAGIREMFFSPPDRTAVKKVLIARRPGSRIRLDALLPNSQEATRRVLALDRGSRVGEHGRDLVADSSADSSISLADEYGNHDQLLTLNLGNSRVHSPVWLNATTIAFGKDGVVHNPEKSKLLGVFQFQTDSGRIQQIASELGIRFLSKAPGKNALAIAGDKGLYTMDSLSDPGSLRRIFSLAPYKGVLLSVAWAPDDRIYFTVDDPVPLDDRHYLNRSRIASIKADGTDLKPDWASDSDHSYRYPTNTDNGEIIFCRFDLDGKHQTLWSRNTWTGNMRPVAESALRAVYLDSRRSCLYYIYQQDLHLRDLRSGADWVIANSVTEADYFHSDRP